ncbi:MAG: PQQ-binding-like beta-propeller repeat protein, partial [Planctomycetaceae bacterium]
YASATPATDGKRVYVLFASDQRLRVLAYDFNGQHIWASDLGAFHQRESQVHGCGTSPIVYQDTVIVANQQDGPSSIIALDSATGKTRWKTPRTLRLTAHSTPFVIRGEQRSGDRLYISNTGDGVASLHPGSGAVISRADLLTSRCVGSPVRSGDFVLATCGGGGRGKFLAAIPVDAKGDVSKSHLGWTRDRILPYVPTPIVNDSLLFLWGDNGAVACLQTKNGEEVWVARVGGNYSGSPICIDGKIYCIAHDGTVAVVAAAPTFKLLGKSQLGEGCHSTPAVSGGRMFIRGFDHLFCLQARTDNPVED